MNRKYGEKSISFFKTALVISFFVLLYSISGLNDSMNSNNHFTPKTSEYLDSYVEIYCGFENGLDEYYDHSTRTFGSYEFFKETSRQNHWIQIQSTTSYAGWYVTRDFTQGTVDFWYKPTYIPHDNEAYYLVAGSSNAWGVLGIYQYNGLILGFHYNADDNLTDHIRTTQEVVMGNIYHIAYTFGPSGTRLFINNTLIDSTNDTRPLHPSFERIATGKCYSTGNGFSQQGYYDEIRLSKVQRSDFSDAMDRAPGISISTIPVDFQDPSDPPDPPDPNSPIMRIIIPIIVSALFVGVIAIIVVKYKQTEPPSVKEKHNQNESPKMHHICSLCGKEHYINAKICTECGSELK